jgi:hypothetical protein
MLTGTTPRDQAYPATDWICPSRAVCALSILVAFAVPARAAGTGRLLVRSDPRGARIYLDEDTEPRAKAPCLLRDIPAGVHVLRARLDGYADLSREVEVSDGELGRLTLTLTAGTTEEAGDVDEPGPSTVDPGSDPSVEPPERSDPAPDEAGDIGAGDDAPPKYVEVDCPVCRGAGLLQEMGCPECEGKGYVGRRRCNECDGRGRAKHQCSACKGEGGIVHGGREATCPRCGGKGKLPCGLCRGSGKLKRLYPDYSGKPTKPCPHCDGSGFENRQKCLRCSGNGTVSLGRRRGRRTVGCPSCGGDGVGPPRCRRCRGSGLSGSEGALSVCLPCFGTGREFPPCRSCKGQGWIRAR